MAVPGKQIGGECFHVRDCYVWAEISYLDSPTAYREFLPQPAVPPRTVVDSDLMMLDSCEKAGIPRGWMSLLVCCFLAAIVLWLYLLYFQL